MRIRAIAVAAFAALLPLLPTAARATGGPADFTVHAVTIEVLRLDGSPVEGALVRAVSEDWGWRHPREAWEWLVTGADGRVTTSLVRGSWAIVAAGDLGFSNAHPGRGLFLAREGVWIDADGVVTLQVDRETTWRQHAVGGGPLSVDEMRATLAGRAPGWVSAPCGWSSGGQLVVETSLATDDVAFAAVHRNDPGTPGYLLLGTASPGATIEITPTPASVTTLRLQAYDMNGAPTDGNMEVRPPTYDSNNFVWDYHVPGARTVYTNAPVARFNPRFIPPGEYFYFIGDTRDLRAGQDTTIAFGGQLNSFVHVIPRNNAEFGQWTQVWLQVSDSYAHTLQWLPTSTPVHFKVFEDGVLAAESDFDGFYTGFPRWFAESPTTTCELSIPCGSFGTMGIGDTLFAPRNLYPTSGAGSPHFAAFAPGEEDDATAPLVEFMERYYDALRPLAWGEIGDRVQIVVDVTGAGAPGEVVPLKLPLNVLQSVDLRLPATLFFPGHEMGHVRLLHPSCGRRLQVPFQEYGESYATLLCLEGFEGLVPASVLEAERGTHDLVFRHLAFGTPVADVWDRTETLQWVEDWILANFGWEIHRRIMFGFSEELAPLRQALLDHGFEEWEAVPVLYSRLAGENLGWLWDLAHLGVGTERVQEGLDLIANVGAPGSRPVPMSWLAAPAPNPARDATTLRFGLARDGDARLEIFDVAGRLVATPVAGRLLAGEHRARWDLRRADGAPCAPGLYFARLRAGDTRLERRIAIAR